MQALKKEAAKEFTQFEITTELLRNLNKFNLTPVTKLVLLELTTHLNQDKNGSVVFPSINFIAEVLGIGITATKKAINDLINEGIIIKSKRDKVRGNYNKYLLRLAKIDFKADKIQNEYKYTSQDIKSQKTQNKPSENVLFKQPKCGRFMITNKEEQKTEQKDLLKGGNVYLRDDKILEQYAIKHGAKNVQAYVNKLKSTGSAKKIIENNAYRCPHTVEATQKLLQKYAEYKKDTCTAAEAGCDLKSILGRKVKNNLT